MNKSFHPTASSLDDIIRQDHLLQFSLNHEEGIFYSMCTSFGLGVWAPLWVLLAPTSMPPPLLILLLGIVVLSLIVSFSSLYMCMLEAGSSRGAPGELCHALYQRRLQKRVKREDKREGWRPREGVKHPKGRSDLHDRWRVEIIAVKDQIFRVETQHWYYGDPRLSIAAGKKQEPVWIKNLLEVETFKENDIVRLMEYAAQAQSQAELKTLEALEEQALLEESIQQDQDGRQLRLNQKLAQSLTHRLSKQ